MIEINNLTRHSIDEDFLKKVAKIVLGGESASRRRKNLDLSLAFVSQARMKEINKKYRHKNRVTDVLSFPGIGEIIICLREVKKNAKKFNSSFKKELAKVLIHGILHLLGYDHEKEKKEAEIMNNKEEYYLSKIK